ncbi:LacI family DNA-binding transcriptional regulator [Dactylosporangium darangshiense]|uniref:LacI family DNA-binding transcriptional regulator n=1 Tax=Dactylosporangium darangshiense TaxID=579108 RepID=UPI0036370AD8
MPGTPRRLTQRDIARMTGVSQATVSLVLNGRSDADVRIAPETRERVLQAIRDSGYVADPIARRLAARDNRIIGVFTYEPVFPAGNSDFYHPFLVGIEEQAEALGSDLLLLTSAPVIDGRRRIFHEGNRLRLADGCILLGRSLDREELTRLVADGFPFVSVGRRADAGGPVPYVGADYAGATAALVERAVALGHTRLAYLGQGRVRSRTRTAGTASTAAWPRPARTACTSRWEIPTKPQIWYTVSRSPPYSPKNTVTAWPWLGSRRGSTSSRWVSRPGTSRTRSTRSSAASPSRGAKWGPRPSRCSRR